MRQLGISPQSHQETGDARYSGPLMGIRRALVAVAVLVLGSGLVAGVAVAAGWTGSSTHATSVTVARAVLADERTTEDAKRLAANRILAEVHRDTAAVRAAIDSGLSKEARSHLATVLRGAAAEIQKLQAEITKGK